MPLCVPSVGMIKNPPATAPSTPPSVFALYTRPTSPPSRARLDRTIRMMAGNDMPKKNVGGNNTRNDRKTFARMVDSQLNPNWSCISRSRSGNEGKTINVSRQATPVSTCTAPKNDVACFTRSIRAEARVLPTAMPHNTVVSMVVKA